MFYDANKSDRKIPISNPDFSISFFMVCDLNHTCLFLHCLSSSRNITIQKLKSKMMKRLYCFLLVFAVGWSVSIAQVDQMKGADICSQKKINSPNLVTKFFDMDSPHSPKHNFDVINYKIYVDIRSCFLTPYPKNYNGTVTISFRVDSSLNTIDLNAVNNSLTINSVELAGTSFTHSGNILTVALNRTYSPGETADVRINFTHKNVTDNAFNVSGGMVFTDCEPEGARKWFPCYDHPSDKATLDLTAKVPLAARLGSNGRLNDSLVTGDTIYYHWVSRDPISTYLIVMSAKINYGLHIVYWHKLSNPQDSIPIRFYFNSGESTTNMEQQIIPMMTLFSQRFGEHPYEKNGFAALNNQFVWGGMENQTLTSICPGCWYANLISHEFGHQWFGDLVTCGTWADIWLNEGFATYLEAIWLEGTSGYSAYKSDIDGDATGYLQGNPGWPIYNPQWAIVTPPTNELFNTAITYYKGACVLHMLRYTLGDSLFFNALKSYAMDSLGGFKFNSSVTDDFAAKISSTTGQDLTWFINQWVKEPNHPVYQNFYGISSAGAGNWNVNFQARQTQTNSVFHKMPIELKIAFTSGPDTLIRVMNDVNYQSFNFTFGRQPSSLIFDPNNNIVLKQASTMLGVQGSESLTPDRYKLYQNYPNPFNPSTKIKFEIPSEVRNEMTNVRLIIYDALGKEVQTLVNERLNPGSYVVDFDANNFSAGVYFYKLESGNYIQTRRMVLLK